MFEDTLELAENKLLLLYIFHKIKAPISNNQITQMILENNFINYFTLQQYIAELVQSKFLQILEDENKHRLLITEKGEKVLSLFINRISKVKLETIDIYLENQRENIKREVSTSSDYTIENKDKFVVNLKAIEGNINLLDLKITVDSNNLARELCTKWKNDSSKKYEKILQILLED